MNGEESIRDYIAFPKNNSGRDVMIDSPSKSEKSLKATKDLNNAILNTDITFIAVDTPSKKKGIDLRQIKFVINKISIALLLKLIKINWMI